MENSQLKGINLDIWKIISFKVKLFVWHCALLLQNTVTSATSDVSNDAGNMEQDSALCKMEWAEHMSILPSAQLAWIFNYTVLLRRTGLNEMQTEDHKWRLLCLQLLYNVIQLEVRITWIQNCPINEMMKCKGFQKQNIPPYTCIEPSRAYGIPLEEGIPCTELSAPHHVCILW